MDWSDLKDDPDALRKFSDVSRPHKTDSICQQSHRTAYTTRTQLSSWVDSFMEYTDSVQSPPRVDRWAAIGAVAGALERKVRIKSQAKTYSPISTSSSLAHQVWQNARPYGSLGPSGTPYPKHHVADIGLTKAAFIDSLASNSRQIYHPFNALFHSLLIAAPRASARFFPATMPKL